MKLSMIGAYKVGLDVTQEAEEPLMAMARFALREHLTVCARRARRTASWFRRARSQACPRQSLARQTSTFPCPLHSDLLEAEGGAFLHLRAIVSTTFNCR
jgi:hypothetical protein